jgi:hypothetical protein
MFDIRETRETFNWVVNGVSLGEKFKFIGEYKVVTFDEFIAFRDEVLKGIKTFENGVDDSWRPYAKRICIGWVNLPGQQDTWIGENGAPIDCTPASYEQLLNRNGVAQAIVYNFMDACRATEMAPIAQGQDDGLGNSQASPDAGSTETSEPESVT